MARRGRPTVEVVLTDDERETLERWARRPKSAQVLALRCRVVLLCADGATNTEVVERLGVTHPTVSKWRHRFAERRLEGLSDEPPTWGPPIDHRRPSRSGDRQDLGGDADRCHTLVDSFDGRRPGNESVGHQPDLASFRTQAPSGGLLQALS
jgi:transposase-like protein